MKIIQEDKLDLILIPGAEVTTSEGHLLVLGIEDLPPRGLSPEETTDLAREQGGIAIQKGKPYLSDFEAEGKSPFVTPSEKVELYSETLAKDGIEAEVIDLRSLRPIDDETVFASIRRTRRAVVVDEGWRTGSLSGEIAARVQEACFWHLDAPVARVCSAEVPVPYPKHLETAVLPQPAGIVAAVKSLPGIAR